jgi:hypothetical protein
MVRDKASVRQGCSVDELGLRVGIVTEIYPHSGPQRRKHLMTLAGEGVLTDFGPVVGFATAAGFGDGSDDVRSPTWVYGGGGGDRVTVVAACGMRGKRAQRLPTVG